MRGRWSLLLGPLRALRRGLLAVLGWLITLLILFEEWGWDSLQRALQWLARWGWVRRFEHWLAGLSPPAALATLLLPSLLLLPVKLTALWLIAQGHPVLGLGVVLSAKVVGTALVARIFSLTQPALMRMPWFARLYGSWTAWKTTWLERVRSSPLWIQARRLKASAAGLIDLRLRPALRHLRGWLRRLKLRR